MSATSGEAGITSFPSGQSGHLRQALPLSASAHHLQAFVSLAPVQQTEIQRMHIRIVKNRLSTVYVSPEKCISSRTHENNGYCKSGASRHTPWMTSGKHGTPVGSPHLTRQFQGKISSPSNTFPQKQALQARRPLLFRGIIHNKLIHTGQPVHHVSA